jgi:cytochrome c biogenesis protein
MTLSTPPQAPDTLSDPPERPSRLAGALAFLRNTWRGLTSMRTALILLFLLALAALPGALLPQHALNQEKVDEYLKQHPTLGPLLDRTGFFDVFASPWFAAIYLLLFVSLIGCLAPRTIEYARACRARPVVTPRNLTRLPHHASGARDGTVTEARDAVRARLRGWRSEVRNEDGGTVTVSAERGYLREAGNLVFHLSLLGLLVGIAVGKLFGYSGQVIVLADGDQFCNTGILNYDSFNAGSLVDGTRLAPFCVKINSSNTEYLPNGQPKHYQADLGYQDAKAMAEGSNGPWRPYRLEVNAPLRLEDDRVYLLGTGYAPQFTVRFPDGATRTQTIQWKTADPNTMLAEGATKFDRPNLPTEALQRQNQLAINGLLAPTSSGGKVITSVYPALLNPEVAVQVYRGDLGLDDGRGQSIYQIDQRQVQSGALKQVAMRNLFVGESLTLDDGTTIRFDGVTKWVGLQVSHDPAQGFVLLFAVLMLLGLGCSLTIKRRRFWARISPAGAGRAQLELGGLARTDQAGYGEEFDRLRAALLAPVPDSDADADADADVDVDADADADADQRDSADGLGETPSMKGTA